MVLERFNVPDEEAILVSAADMTRVIEQLFLACELDQAGAEQCAEVLIANDLRGNESHGVSNQLRGCAPHSPATTTHLPQPLQTLPRSWRTPSPPTHPALWLTDPTHVPTSGGAQTSPPTSRACRTRGPTSRSCVRRPARP